MKQITAAVLLLTYVLITLSRWLHPATFTSATSLVILLIGVTLLVISLVRHS